MPALQAMPALRALRALRSLRALLMTLRALVQQTPRTLPRAARDLPHRLPRPSVARSSFLSAAPSPSTCVSALPSSPPIVRGTRRPPTGPSTRMGSPRFVPWVRRSPSGAPPALLLPAIIIILLLLLLLPTPARFPRVSSWRATACSRTSCRRGAGSWRTAAWSAPHGRRRRTRGRRRPTYAASFSTLRSWPGWRSCAAAIRPLPPHLPLPSLPPLLPTLLSPLLSPLPPLPPRLRRRSGSGGGPAMTTAVARGPWPP